MITVRLCEDLYADVCWYSRDLYSSPEEEYEDIFSSECASFIDKTMEHARRCRRGRAHWYEVEVTPEEVSAVIEEVVKAWISDYGDRADYSYDPKERSHYRTTVRKYRKFIAEHERKETK